MGVGAEGQGSQSEGAGEKFEATGGTRRDPEATGLRSEGTGSSQGLVSLSPESHSEV